MAHYITRGELYSLVWSTPMKLLAPRFGISDVALAKHCQRLQIPLPNRGYWARQRAGRKTLQTPLGLRPPGMSDAVTIGKEPYWQGLSEEELLGPLSAEPVFPEELSSVVERVRQMLGKVAVAKYLEHSHALVARLLEADEQRRQKQRNSAYPSIFDNPIFESPIEQRRLRIINALFLTVERCGCKPSIRDRNGRELYVQVGQQHVGFSLDQVQTDRRLAKGTQAVKKGESNKLKLELQSFNDRDKIHLSWQDDGVKKLERQIGEIAVQLIVAGEAQYREMARRQYEWRVQRKGEMEREVARRKAKDERLRREQQIKRQQERIDRLLAEAGALRKANDIRAYVETAQNANLNTDPVQFELFKAWAHWALGQADRIDPIKNGVWVRMQQATSEDV